LEEKRVNVIMDLLGIKSSNESFTSRTICDKMLPVHTIKEKERSVESSDKLDSSYRPKIMIDVHAGNTSKSRSKNKRALHFHNTASILWIESVEDMSNEEVDACYHSNRDYLEFRDRERNMSRHFSTWASYRENRVEEFIGVESRLQRYQRRQRSKNAVFAVILEQDLREEKEPANVCDTDSLLEVDNDVMIARIYQQYSRESTRLALERGASNAALVNATSPSGFNPLIPWEIPGPRKNKATRDRSVDLIRYSSCTHPILQISSWDQEPKDSQYENRYELQERKTNHGRRRQLAPIKQKIIRSQENCSSNQVAPERQYQYLPRQWPIHCGIVPSNNAPRLLT